MTTSLQRLTDGLRRIHQEEEGMEALQTVLIMALATVVLAFAYKMMSGNGSGEGQGGGILGQVGSMISDGLGKFANKIGSLIQ